MRIAIVGSREYWDLNEVRTFVQSCDRSNIIISGGARGVDTVAVDEARRLGMAVVVYKADWTLYGKAAGFRRNRLIVEDADLVVAFWDGDSKGTAHTIVLAHKANKALKVFCTSPARVKALLEHAHESHRRDRTNTE